MPAFGAFAGGLNVLDEAFHPLFGNGGMAVWMLGQEGLYPVATRLLSARLIRERRTVFSPSFPRAERSGRTRGRRPCHWIPALR